MNTFVRDNICQALEASHRHYETTVTWFCSRQIFPECVAKGSRLTLGGLGVESCSRPVVSMLATVRNRPQPFATVRNRPR